MDIRYAEHNYDVYHYTSLGECIRKCYDNESAVRIALLAQHCFVTTFLYIHAHSIWGHMTCRLSLCGSVATVGAVF